ncbi:MAG: peptidylprolyl isomerase [Planctomycetes bacterium]|nr:peptidylprolyl isomerase [Planctomycetota bacterium]
MDDILPSLIEIAGNEVINDYVLRVALKRQLDAHSLHITSSDINAEEILFHLAYSDLSRESMEQILLQRGYGPVRKQNLLWRNAALRKLVASDVSVTEASIRRMYEIIHGVSYPARIIVTTTHKEANEVFNQLQEGVSFSDLATKFSIDPSASRGGLVDPIPVADPLWPEPIRAVLPTTKLGEYTNPIFIGDRWILVLVTGKSITSGTSFEEAKEQVKKLAKLAQERFLMEKLASELQAQQSITFFNDALEQVSSTNVD